MCSAVDWSPVQGAFTDFYAVRMVTADNADTIGIE